MSTKRQTILTAIKTILEGIVDGSGNRRFPHVEVSRIPPTRLDVVPYPAVFVYSDREMRVEDERAVNRQETWEWYITLEVWAYDKDMEDLLDYIHTAMYANYKFTNTAEWSDRMSVDFFTIDPLQRLEAMAISYRVIYRHSLGNMTTSGG